MTVSYPVIPAKAKPEGRAVIAKAKPEGRAVIAKAKPEAIQFTASLIVSCQPLAKAENPLLYQGIAGQVPHDGSLSHSFP
jgi:hypothetical protein